MERKIHMDGLKNIVIVVLIIIIVLMQQCNTNPTIVGTGGNPHVDTLKTSVRHIIYVDTVPFYDTIPRYIRVEIPIPTPITEINEVGDTIEAFEYVTEVHDSLIDGKITSKVEGILLSQDFKYVPKFPKYILRTDSFIITHDIERSRNQLYLGMEIGGTVNTLDLGPKAQLKTRNNFIYSYHYGLVGKTHNISATKLFRLRRGK